MSSPLTATDLVARLGVSRETGDRLAAYVALLATWQKRINLVGPSTLADPWRRHILDSAQLMPHIAAGSSVVDLGSGAGFPGLVLAILGDFDVHLIESDQRKAVFLREAARVTGAAVTVHARRLETVTDLTADVITARALAPLDKLLAWALPFTRDDSFCLFLKGQSSQQELTAARKQWTLSVTLVESWSAPQGVLMKIWDFRHDSAA